MQKQRPKLLLLTKSNESSKDSISSRLYKDAYPVLLEESKAKVAAIKQMIETAKLQRICNGKFSHFICGHTCVYPFGYTQVSLAADDRPVVGVTQFTCDEESPYTGLVTEKVAEMLTNTHRFVVVDRTSLDKVVDERELQKSEAFLDSHNLAKQGAAVAAEQLVTGHIVKIPVYRMKTVTEAHGAIKRV